MSHILKKQLLFSIVLICYNLIDLQWVPAVRHVMKDCTGTVWLLSGAVFSNQNVVMKLHCVDWGF